MKSKLKLALFTTSLFVFAGGGARMVYAAPSAGGCSMLTPTQIQKVLGQPFGAPTETKASPAYAGQSWGSNCRYISQQGPHVAVEFIVYVDATPTDARQTFQKLSLWFPAKSKPPIGDSAYIGSNGAIHVLKGKVRYYIAIDPSNEKETKDLAASIAGRI